MKRIILLYLIFPFIAFSQNGIEQTFENLKSGSQKQKALRPFSLNTNTALAESFFKEDFAPTFLNFSQSAILEVDSSTHLLNLTLPINATKSIELELFAVNIFSPEFKVLNSLNQEVPFAKGLFYHGRIKGDNQSIAAVSFINGEVFGMVSDKTGNRTLKKQLTENVYALYYEHGLKNQESFKCDTPEGIPSTPASNPGTQGVTGCKIVNIYIEADYQLYLNKGSSITTTSDYVASIFNQVAVLYKNENLAIQLSAVKVWNTADPYTGTSTSTVLSQLRTALGTSFNGNLAHLFSGRNLGGGIAYLDVLCSKSSGFGVNIMTFGGFYNGGFTTSPVGEIAHEMGHNFGSRHTHWCGWSGGAIDNCGPTAGYSEGSCTPPATAAGSGTIMSYCHLLSGIQTYNANGFGTQPGNLIRAEVAACTQLTVNNAVPTAPTTSAITTTTATLAWTIPTTSTNFTVRYRAVGSGTWLTSTTASSSKALSGLVSGTQYEWQVTGDCSNGIYTASIVFTTVPTASISASLSASASCQGNTVTVNYTLTGAVNAGNVFTAQLSNASGSFASPVSIGSVTAISSGNITASIPANAVAGSGYKIRVVSGTPVLISNETNFTINAFPATPGITSTNGNTICSGTTTVLAVSNCSGTVSWLPSGSGASLPVSPLSTTVYTATCTQNGCGSSAPFTLTVTPLPAAPTARILSYAATPSNVWEKKFGGSGFENLYKILELTDGNLLWVGVSSSPVSGDKTLANVGGKDAWIIKTDAQGNKLWEKTYGGTGDDMPKASIATPNGGAIIALQSTSGISGDKTTDSYGAEDIWLLKINTNGVIERQWVFGGSAKDVPADLISTNDGNYVLTTLSYSNGGTGNKNNTSASNYGDADVWMIKVDPNSTNPLAGDIWQKTFGGTSEDIPSAALETATGDLLLAAYSKSTDNGNKTSVNFDGNANTFDYWVLKLSSTGTVLWDNSYGGAKEPGDPTDEGYGDDLATSIIKSNTAGNYLIGGISKSQAGTGNKISALRGDTDGWLVEINGADGSKINEKVLGGANKDDFNKIVAMPNGAGYWLSMQVSHTNSGDITATPLGMNDFWVAELDNDFAIAPRWDRRYGGAFDDSPSNIALLVIQSGDLIVAGSKADNASNSAGSAQDYFAVKLTKYAESTADTICSGGANLTAQGCLGTVAWSNGMSGNSITVTEAGTYTAACTENNCTGTMSNAVTVVVVPPTLLLSGTAASGVLDAVQTISSTQVIPSGVAMTYRAGNGILLEGVFEAQTGSVFRAEIKGCN